MEKKIVGLVCFALSVVAAAAIGSDVQADDEPGHLPIVIWHGMGDNCCHSWSMGYVKQLLQDHLDQVYVRSLMIGSGPAEDTTNGFFKPVNQQVEEVCEKIRSDPELQSGYNAIGFSQGGQFLRAVAQRCPHGMRKLISVGGQHQGVYGLPRCFGDDNVICDYVRRLLNYGAYMSWIQDSLVQAEYWHDPLDEDTYSRKSVFLADINNAKPDHKNQTYKDNLTKLEKLVLIKFENDSVVDPRGTEWFEFYHPGQAHTMQPYNETELYVEDTIGLKTLDESGRLDFISLPGDHLKISEDFIINVLIKQYLANNAHNLP